MIRRSIAALAVGALALTVLAGCASSRADTPGEPGPSGIAPPGNADPGPSGELTIYAAASLGTAFDELAEQFEQRHPSVEVSPIVYDGSSTLATQILEGAPADVFASADEKNMDTVAALAMSPEIFASNTLVIAVPSGNPGGVTGLESLADPALTVVLCAPDVPCGSASERLLDAQGVAVRPASIEQNVTAVLAKIAAGEADAGLVYATDVMGVADVEAIAPAGAADVVNRYPVTVLRDAANRDAAAAFVAFVVSADGQAVLRDRGFGAP
jgi:molybdate transport system substrate-binding protein